MKKIKKIKIKFINSKLISTDDILPAKYKHMYVNKKKLSKYIFINKYPNIKFNNYQSIASNGIFGIGSSREQAVEALLETGIKVIIAKNFGRIFFRNSWNLGLILIESKINKNIDNKFIKINFKKKKFFINNIKYNFNPPNKKILSTIKYGGIIKYILNKHIKKNYDI